MNSTNSTPKVTNRGSNTKIRDPRLMRAVQILSWIITLVFIVALIGAIYEAVVNNNPLPVWAWLGILALFAVAAGLAVMVIVYRGVVKETGPFDYSSSVRVTGELKNEASKVVANGASSLQVNLEMMAGVLNLSNGTAGVMEASFTYDDADWKPPVVDYSVDASGKGNLAVEQKATGRASMRQGRCEWEVRLGEDLPTDLNIRFGAGKADLKLAGLNLSRLRVESGVGELNMDLGGDWRRSMEASIKAGIGDTTLRLPQNSGVRVQSTVGFGSIKPHSLSWDGEAFKNELYGQSEVNLDITIDGGMGKINLLQAD